MKAQVTVDIFHRVSNLEHIHVYHGPRGEIAMIRQHAYYRVYSTNSSLHFHYKLDPYVTIFIPYPGYSYRIYKNRERKRINVCIVYQKIRNKSCTLIPYSDRVIT